MKVGLAGRGFYGVGGMPTSETLALARAHGLDGFFFPSPFDVSPTLDAGELREAKALADDLGLYLEIGIGRVNPLKATQNPEVLACGEGDFRRGMERMIRTCREIGCTELWCLSGGDRFSTTVPWGDQLHAIQRFLLSLAPLARDLGCHLNLETHEDITSFEVVRMVEAIGPDALGITLDIANVVVRAEDPVAATRRVAPYVRQTHVEDVALSFVTDGLWRTLQPCGEGIIDWEAVIGILGRVAPALNLSIELHRGQFGMDIFDAAWLALQPDLTVVELAEIVRLARASETRVADGVMIAPHALPESETDAQRTERLQTSMRYLRAILHRHGFAAEEVG